MARKKYARCANSGESEENQKIGDLYEQSVEARQNSQKLKYLTFVIGSLAIYGLIRLVVDIINKIN